MPSTLSRAPRRLAAPGAVSRRFSPRPAVSCPVLASRTLRCHLRALLHPAVPSEPHPYCRRPISHPAAALSYSAPPTSRAPAASPALSRPIAAALACALACCPYAAGPHL
ncbi:hypothetical protein DENSPDRAFT_845291 [Dentipellis sp. KUC8613]|nr:hypothetical protein DENSPDRAFT_845291 [Dentipellis sp. KUC8613]